MRKKNFLNHFTFFSKFCIGLSSITDIDFSTLCRNVPEPLEKTAQESLSKEQQENFSLGLERKIKKDGESDEGSINSSSDPDTFDGSSDSDGSDDDDDFVTVPDTCNIKDQQPDQPLEQP